jgi:4a-hydroxytetrahydrobiopterin dehydratase
MSRLIEKDRLVGHQLSRALDPVPHWQLAEDAGKISRTLVFRNFIEAFGFMTQAALVAESSNHHPEWSNVWNRVELALTTHTAGGITRADIQLALALDEIATRFELSCALDDGVCGGCA